MRTNISEEEQCNNYKNIIYKTNQQIMENVNTPIELSGYI